MIAWINFGMLIGSGLLILYFYVKSVRPVALELEIGPTAYARCARYRLVSSIFMLVAAINYAVYYFYPLPIPLPLTFPWPWWVSALIAVLIALPSAAFTPRSGIPRPSARWLFGG